ncbi:primosomal protein DnaI [Marinococcus halophilus]|uniref:Primosomal protein DnaI n=1 Tax=Marinococcus halophilus TaxID=1371 RepID=A0A510Y464_MARHA|nr:primosomal protein DnaI [Marinococcus halophilus]OZT79970.1 primosomal protein DnaI [Marinococcus halophilus]GEK58112.1 primosomal protein DnaI [Marinococcus halophilus]
MDSIGSSLNGWMDKGWKERMARLEKEVFAYPGVIDFKHRHPHIPTEEYEKNKAALFEYKRERSNCDACPGLENCPNLMQGYQPELMEDKGKVTVAYHRCSLKVHDDEKKKRQSLIKSYYIPKEILHASFDQVDMDHQSRAKAGTTALHFASTTVPGEDGKGLYLYGKFGVGKTYIAGAIMNELAERSIGSMIVHVPDFFREIKESLSDNTVREKVDSVKGVPVLVLDDLGAESMSAWTRDDILGVILQYRMMEKLPTVYTSNYDYSELEEHLTYSQKGGNERLKAKRIMERIRPFTEEVFMDGQNRRG